MPYIKIWERCPPDNVGDPLGRYNGKVVVGGGRVNKGVNKNFSLRRHPFSCMRLSCDSLINIVGVQVVVIGQEELTQDAW